eukprot:TRINITY_DN13168_c0_g1_i2.p2 TRINITY_DN13168_c0_g1~~TRINITY_DN13168_c0_g1_i2.p2  ORF type:complete len:211 (+),score=69.74 TRINITY_DN13168_c0_g1_i2:79-633(+)
MLATPTLVAAAGIVAHVVHYNASAQLEHRTRIYTKVLGKNAVYMYALLLVVCALARDHFINAALTADAGTGFELFSPTITDIAAYALFGFGIALNMWTLQALGIKGMYNGDSFGFLMDAPVTGGPFAIFNDPQYVGTTMAMLSSALWYRSLDGYLLTALMGSVFYVSVHFIEGPHMARIYAKKK